MEQGGSSGRGVKRSTPEVQESAFCPSPSIIRSIPLTTATSEQTQSPAARRIRIRHISPPNNLGLRCRSGYRGLSPLEEEENVNSEHINRRTLLNTPQIGGEERSSSRSGNKRGLSLYEHLDLTDPRSLKRSRPETQVVVQQSNVDGVDVVMESGRNSDNSGPGEAMVKFQKQLSEVLQETQIKIAGMVQSTVEGTSEQTINALRKQLSEMESELGRCRVENNKLNGYKTAYEQSVKCQICFEKNRHVVLMPCMHFMYCADCIGQHRRASGSFCPYCRTSLQGELAVNMMNQISSPSASQQ